MKQTRKRLSRRGVTVVEAMVAMAIIAIVSFGALSVIRSSRSTAGADAAYEQARYRAEAALECFKFADDQTEFEQALDGLLTKQDDGNYTYTASVATLTVTVTYPDGGRPTFKAVGTGKNNRSLFDITYTKGTEGGAADENENISS